MPDFLTGLLNRFTRPRPVSPTPAPMEVNPFLERLLGAPRTIGARPPMATQQPMATPMATPQPTPEPTAEPVGNDYYYSLIKRYFPPEEWENASRIMEGESSVNPAAENKNEDGTLDYGLFQINEVQKKNLKNWLGYKYEDMKDPNKNVKFAAELWKRQGWNPWYTPYARRLVESQRGE